ncbi:hypothetical protein [Ectothiorhodospira shaposhnikovii]|uniref:hypothetical protein n=1 Tax=Ectothiorhodospira shaposhnikovii TaxID=1054 RepID=UPI0039A1B92D
MILPLWRDHERLAVQCYRMLRHHHALALGPATPLARLERRLLAHWLILARDPASVCPDDGGDLIHVTRCAARWLSTRPPAPEEVRDCLREHPGHPWGWLLEHLPPEHPQPWLEALTPCPTLAPWRWRMLAHLAVPAPEICPAHVPAAPDEALAALRWGADVPWAPADWFRHPDPTLPPEALGWQLRGGLVRGLLPPSRIQRHEASLAGSAQGLRLLGATGLPQVLPRLLDALPEHPAAAWGLALHGTRAATDILIGALADPRALPHALPAFEAVSGLTLPGIQGPRPLSVPSPQEQAMVWWRRVQRDGLGTIPLWQGRPRGHGTLLNWLEAHAGQDTDGPQLLLSLGLGRPLGIPPGAWQNRRHPALRQLRHDT